MSTHVTGFQSFVSHLHNFVLAKLATSSISPDEPSYNAAKIILTNSNERLGKYLNDKIMFLTQNITNNYCPSNILQNQSLLFHNYYQKFQRAR